MPLTTIEGKPALVVIDLQGFVRNMPAAHPIAEVIDRNVQLARAFRKQGFPVVLVRVTDTAPGRTDSPRINVSGLPSGWADLLTELGQQADDLLIVKNRWGAFIGTSLDEDLRQLDVTQVFVTGVATSAGVESTARSAFDHGYHVVLVLDAMTDRDLEAHRHTTEKVFPRLGETCTTGEILQLLDAKAVEATSLR